MGQVSFKHVNHIWRTAKKKKIPKAYYSAIKMSEILLFAAMCMVLENGIFSEVRKILYNITFTWKLKKKTLYKVETDSYIENKLCLLKGKSKGRRINWELGTNRYKLLYIK